MSEVLEEAEKTKGAKTVGGVGWVSRYEEEGGV